MRHLTRIAVLGTVVSLAVSACGGSSNALQGKSPQQMVQLASTSISSGAFHVVLNATMKVDTSQIQGLPPGTLDQMASALRDITMTGSGDVQDETHAKLQMTMKPLLDKQVQMILFDGSTYMSQDGGKTWADLGSFDFNGLQVSPSDAAAQLKQLSNVQDLGSTTRDGVAVQHLHADVPSDYVKQQLGKLGGGGGQLGQLLQQLGPALTNAIQIKDGTVDAWVRQSDGKLDAMDTHMSMAIDMGTFIKAIAQAFGGQIPSGDQSQINAISGAMTMVISSSQTYSNYGEKVSIEKPTVDPNAPTLGL
jgi:hypothetical protein